MKPSTVNFQRISLQTPLSVIIFLGNSPGLDRYLIYPWMVLQKGIILLFNSVYAWEVIVYDFSMNNSASPCSMEPHGKSPHLPSSFMFPVARTVVGLPLISFFTTLQPIFPACSL